MNKTPVWIRPWLEALTAWKGIDPDALRDRVIELLLREENNLIQVNEDNEVYVDLQLPAGITPSDEFPVWVTTWRILQADGRPQSGTILNWKTTSWDYVRFIYANDGKLYYDPWTWTWREFWTGWECKVHIFEALPDVDDDITDLYTSVIYDERYLTVLEDGERNRYCWVVTGHVFPENWNPWHIYAVWYGWEWDGWQLIPEDYVWLTSLDITFVENNDRRICTWIKVNKYGKGIRLFSVPNIWDDVTEMYHYLSDTSNIAIFITDNPLQSIFPNGTPYAIWNMSNNYIANTSSIRIYTFFPWEWPKAITIWFTADAYWLYECSSLTLKVPAIACVDSVAPTSEAWTLWYDTANSVLKIYDGNARQTI